MTAGAGIVNSFMSILVWRGSVWRRRGVDDVVVSVTKVFCKQKQRRRRSMSDGSA